MGLVSVKALIIVDSEGKRILSKYYIKNTIKEQQRLEQLLFEKTKRLSSDILLFENLIVVYKPVVDCFCYVLGGLDENEIMLSNVLQTFIDSLAFVMKNQVEKSTILQNMQSCLLCLDEIIDDGFL